MFDPSTLIQENFFVILEVIKEYRKENKHEKTKNITYIHLLTAVGRVQQNQIGLQAYASV